MSEPGLQDLLLLVLRQRREGLLLAVDLDRELAGHEAADARDALLAVEHLEHVVVDVEVDQPERVALQQRVDDGDVLLAVVVDVVALVLRLDDELAGQAEQTLALELVVDEALEDLARRCSA